MKCIVLAALLLGLSAPGEVGAQVVISAEGVVASSTVGGQPQFNPLPSKDPSLSSLDAATTTLRVLPADQAMARFQLRSTTQSVEMVSHSAISVIRAELPDTSQRGEYEVQKTFIAPRTLRFKPIRFVGDTFVKLNIIARLLQSEVDHMSKDDVAQTAISAANYRVSYKGEIDIRNHPVHVFQVKPHKKRPGLFKGRIYLDAHTGTLLRAEGRIVKSPSHFVKHVEFVEDYADIDSFTLPVHIHSEARAFLVGRVIIDITHFYYQPVPPEIEALLLKLP